MGIMTTHTTQGVASRMGYGLGRVARFLLYDRNPVLRWVKRGALVVAAVFFSAEILNWIGHIFMAVLTIGLILFAIVKGDFSLHHLGQQDDSVSQDDGFRFGLFGYGQYLNGARIDSDEE